MTFTGLKIAHITIDGKEIDEETDIKAAPDLTQKSSDVLAMYNGKKPMFIKFYANWCGHCKKIKPEWDETAEEVNKKNKKMLKVNCGNGSKKEKEIMSKYNIDGYPTIIVFDNGVASPYEGKRTKEAFKEALS